MTELSDYEKLRIANILRNEAEMKRLGLDVSKLTNAALGRQAPTATTRRRAVRPKGAPPTRRSLRAMGKPAPAYSDAAVERDARQVGRRLCGLRVQRLQTSVRRGVVHGSERRPGN